MLFSIDLLICLFWKEKHSKAKVPFNAIKRWCKKVNNYSVFLTPLQSTLTFSIWQSSKERGLRIRLLLRTTYYFHTITTTSVTFHFLEEAISYCYYALVKQQDILMLPLSHLFFFLLFVSAQQSNLDFSALINELWLRSRCYSRLQKNRQQILRTTEQHIIIPHIWHPLYAFSIMLYNIVYVQLHLQRFRIHYHHY